jgi:hypothetical protein
LNLKCDILVFTKFGFSNSTLYRYDASGKFRESVRRKFETELFPKMMADVRGMAPPKCLKWQGWALFTHVITSSVSSYRRVRVRVRRRYAARRCSQKTS